MQTLDPFSEQYIRAHCPHCDPASDAFSDLLYETKYFRIVCDHHPLVEGHILIIPKEHVSCLGEYPEDILSEFIDQYERMKHFLSKQYGSVGTFEHGSIGQTVFHSHVHLLPFAGDPVTIVPEGKAHLVALPSFAELRKLYGHFHRYLFFSINDLAWVVDPALGTPRFFRDRFAAAVNRPERGNWKEMHGNDALMKAARTENAAVMVLWEKNELLHRITSENVHGEIQTGPAVGGEVW